MAKTTRDDRIARTLSAMARALRPDLGPAAGPDDLIPEVGDFDVDPKTAVFDVTTRPEVRVLELGRELLVRSIYLPDEDAGGRPVVRRRVDGFALLFVAVVDRHRLAAREAYLGSAAFARVTAGGRRLWSMGKTTAWKPQYEFGPEQSAVRVAVGVETHRVVDVTDCEDGDGHLAHEQAVASAPPESDECWRRAVTDYADYLALFGDPREEVLLDRLDPGWRQRLAAGIDLAAAAE